MNRQKDRLAPTDCTPVRGAGVWRAVAAEQAISSLHARACATENHVRGGEKAGVAGAVRGGTKSRGGPVTREFSETQLAP
jgi:hypothetical protein